MANPSEFQSPRGKGKESAEKPSKAHGSCQLVAKKGREGGNIMRRDILLIPLFPFFLHCIVLHKSVSETR
jgi:hypothetical protein